MCDLGSIEDEREFIEMVAERAMGMHESEDSGLDDKFNQAIWRADEHTAR
jgi:hypothetical protein